MRRISLGLRLSSALGLEIDQTVQNRGNQILVGCWFRHVAPLAGFQKQQTAIEAEEAFDRSLVSGFRVTPPASVSGLGFTSRT